jgi:hypothetical protein
LIFSFVTKRKSEPEPILYYYALTRLPDRTTNNITMALDLTLPAQAPELGQYSDYNWDNAAFAVYTLDDTVSMQDVVSTLEKQWLEQGNEDHLTRPAAPATRLATLRDVVQTHIALDKGKCERSDGAAAGGLEWWPTAFVVVVRKDWETRPDGLLFVFVDDEDEYKMDKFFFKSKDAYMMLSSLSFGDEELARSKQIYGQEAEA